MSASPAEPRRWTGSNVALGAPSVVVVVSLFLPWFGVSLGPVGLSVDGLSAHRFLFVVLVLALLELSYLSVSSLRSGLGGRLSSSGTTLLVTSSVLEAVLVVVAFADGPAGERLFGAYLGLFGAACACALTLAARRSLGANR